jgi:hypothetical protein
MLYKVTSAHEEGGERVYSVSTTHFEGDEDGNVQWLHLVEVEFVDGKLTQKPGTERKIPAQLVTLAMGFTGTDQENGLVSQFGLGLDERGNIARDADFATNVPGVYVAGDAGRGQSLIVWAIAEGRSAARGVDRFLTGRERTAGPDPPDGPFVDGLTVPDGLTLHLNRRPVQRRTELNAAPAFCPRPDDGGRRGASGVFSRPRRRYPCPWGLRPRPPVARQVLRRTGEMSGGQPLLRQSTLYVTPYTFHSSGVRRPRFPSYRNLRWAVSTRVVSRFSDFMVARRVSRKMSR